MTTCVRVNLDLPPPITQASLAAAIRTAMISAGHSAPVEDKLSGSDQLIIYKIVLDAAAAFGTVYLRIKITPSLVISQIIYTSWNGTSGANPSAETSFTALVSNIPCQLVSLRGGTETQIVLLSQSTVLCILGTVSPERRQPWHNLNVGPGTFISSNDKLGSLRGCSVAIYTTTYDYVTNLNLSYLSVANSFTGLRDVLLDVSAYSPTNSGIFTQFSTDHGSACGSGLARFDRIDEPGASTYFFLTNNIAGAWVIRVSA